jgi:hypothetical protein
MEIITGLPDLIKRVSGRTLHGESIAVAVLLGKEPIVCDSIEELERLSGNRLGTMSRFRNMGFAPVHDNKDRDEDRRAMLYCALANIFNSKSGSFPSIYRDGTEREETSMSGLYELAYNDGASITVGVPRSSLRTVVESVLSASAGGATRCVVASRIPLLALSVAFKDSITRIIIGETHLEAISHGNVMMPLIPIEVFSDVGILEPAWSNRISFIDADSVQPYCIGSPHIYDEKLVGNTWSAEMKFTIGKKGAINHFFIDLEP